MLARQLFPDVIQGCYVEGEIDDSNNKALIQEKPIVIETQTITPEQVKTLQELIGNDEEYKQKLLHFFKIVDFNTLPAAQWERIVAAVKKHAEMQTGKTTTVSQEDRLQAMGA
jgi:hypothetical protein